MATTAHVDLVKLHHGCSRNVTKKFFKNITADIYFDPRIGFFEHCPSSRSEATLEGAILGEQDRAFMSFRRWLEKTE